MSEKTKGTLEIGRMYNIDSANFVDSVVNACKKYKEREGMYPTIGHCSPKNRSNFTTITIEGLNRIDLYPDSTIIAGNIWLGVT